MLNFLNSEYKFYCVKKQKKVSIQVSVSKKVAKKVSYPGIAHHYQSLWFDSGEFQFVDKCWKQQQNQDLWIQQQLIFSRIHLLYKCVCESVWI